MNTNICRKRTILCTPAFVHGVLALAMVVLLAPKPAHAGQRAGDLDQTFGSGTGMDIDRGSRTTSLLRNTSANAVVTQSDAIIAAGRLDLFSRSSGGEIISSAPTSFFRLAIENQGVVAVTAFTATGEAIAVSPQPTVIGQSNAFAEAVAIQSDGRDEFIVVAGTAVVGGTRRFAVARYTKAGKLISGITIPFAAGPASAHAVAIQDGKIVVAGSAGEGSKSVFALARLDAEGKQLDQSFGKDGTGTITTTFFDGFGASANAVIIQKDGAIVAVGSTGLPCPAGTDPAKCNTSTFALARYERINGGLDLKFGNGGRISTPLLGKSGGSALASAASLQNDLTGSGDKIVAAGTSSCPSSDDKNRRCFLVVRYDSVKSLYANTPFVVNITTTGFVNSSAEAKAIAIHNDGRIVLAGSATWPGENCPTTRTFFAVARYLPDLSPDYNGFGTPGTTLVPAPGPEGYVGTAGKVITAIGGAECAPRIVGAANSVISFSKANAVSIQGSNRIIAAGGLEHKFGDPHDPIAGDFALAAYHW